MGRSVTNVVDTRAAMSRTALARSRLARLRRVSALLATLLASCGGGGGPSSIDSTTETFGAVTNLSCVDGQDVAMTDGISGTLRNNAWNRASAGAGDWSQCLRQRTVTTTSPTGSVDGTEVGWSWTWPTVAGLYAYPEILVGRSPWYSFASNDSRFPSRIDALPALTLDFAVEQTSTGRQNLSVDLWVSSTTPATTAPVDPSIIKAEIMVWTAASSGLIEGDSTQAKVAEVTIGGALWSVYAGPQSFTDTNGTYTWTLVTYVRADGSNVFEAQLDLAGFLKDAAERQWIATSDVLSGVEFGNEIVSGSGETWLRRFAVTSR